MNDDVAMLVLVNATTALLGGALAVALGERIGGARKFSLPFAFLLVLAVAGGAMSLRYGWKSTLFLLAAYGVLCVAEGFRTRAQRRRTTA